MSRVGGYFGCPSGTTEIRHSIPQPLENLELPSTGGQSISVGGALMFTLVFLHPLRNRRVYMEDKERG